MSTTIRRAFCGPEAMRKAGKSASMLQFIDLRRYKFRGERNEYPNAP